MLNHNEFYLFRYSKTFLNMRSGDSIEKFCFWDRLLIIFFKPEQYILGIPRIIIRDLWYFPTPNISNRPNHYKRYLIYSIFEVENPVIGRLGRGLPCTQSPIHMSSTIDLTAFFKIGSLYSCFKLWKYDLSLYSQFKSD